ncbi:hypothetical protein ERJ75_000717200 [Trypanosoma vivax]|nr:hypothetical protein TRVL_08048 [Trypanosoma vivax]KAH8613609.1 hypothetical protein ERJ75_000717200 [Trypanosoma vivax]
MTVPEWATSERTIEDAKEYLRQGNSVDFFELVSSHILREQPADVAVFCLELVRRLAGKEVSSLDMDSHPKKLDDNRFIRERNVCDFINEWVLALLVERPATDSDRMQFHERYLQSLVSTESETGHSAGIPASKTNST